MKKETVKYTHVRAIVITLVLAFSFVCLIVVASGQRERFYVELGAYKAGTRIVPIIKVSAVKDKQVYDTVDAANLEFGIKVRGQCPEKYRLNNSPFYIEKGKENRFASINLNEDHRSIGADHGKGWEFFTPSVPFARPNTPFGLVDTCNMELRRRESRGESRIKLLNDGFNLEFEKAYKAELTIDCSRDDDRGFYKEADYYHSYYNSYVYLPVTVRCMPTYYGATKGPPPRPGRPLDIDPPITAVSVVADPPETQGRQCPVYVNFRGKITAGEKSQYSTFNTKYRFIGDHNYQTDWMPVSVLRGQPHSLLGRRFIETPQFDPGGSFKTPGGKTRIPLHHGFMTLEVMLPDSTIRSERANFTVDCNPSSPRIRTKP